MPSFPVLIDTTADFDFSPAQNVTQKRSLLLAPPSIAAHEEKLRDIFATFDRSVTDLQMLDRLSAGLVALPACTYDLVLVLTDTNGARRNEALGLLTRDVFNVLTPSMKASAQLQLQDGPFQPNEGREAILAGLVEKNGAFEKSQYQEAAVPLRFGLNKKKNKVAPEPVKVESVGFVDNYDDDELIDEDDLLAEEDLGKPVQQRKFPLPIKFLIFNSMLMDLSSCRLSTRDRQKATTRLQGLHLRSRRPTRSRRRRAPRKGQCRPQRPQTKH